MRGVCILATVAIAAPAAAQQRDDLTLSGNVRVRYEAISGQPRTGFQDSEDLLNFRTILTAEYRTGPVRIGAELYDSRVYDPGPRSVAGTGEVNALELVQAWVRADLGGGRVKANAQAGRFTLNLGSRRLVAADDYRNTTNGYTGVRLDATVPGNLTATAVYVLPQVRLPDDGRGVRANRVAIDRESFDLRLWGGVVAKAGAIGPVTLEAQYFRLDERDTPRRATRNRRLDTFGLRAFRVPAPGKLDLDVEALRQTGRIRASTAPAAADQAVSAWFVHGEIGYQFTGEWAPHVAIEYDYASGDGRSGDFGRFDTLFGMRRADLAPAGLYNAVGRANLSAAGVRLDVKPSARVEGFAAVRRLRLASRFDSFSTTGVRDASGRSGRDAGTQIEARLRWWAVPKKLQLEGNGLVLRKGRFLTGAPNAPRGGDTRYGSMNATIFF